MSNFEQAAADLQRFLNIVQPAQAALDALTLAGQVQDALAADRHVLEATRGDVEDATAALAALRAAHADEQAVHSKFVAEAREHVEKAKAEAKRMGDEAAMAVRISLSKADDDLHVCREAFAEDLAAHHAVIAGLKVQADTEQARLDSIRAAIAKLTGG